ncbi:hypothetical protein ACH64Q_01990 [Klebsiella pneumoniae]|uniref:hypothetical protein n=1 Tax=Klebsiella pneumoniae TaxID=573 RepID=UPI0039857C2C
MGISVVIYEDVKKVIKWALLLAALIVACIVIYLGYEKAVSAYKESALIAQAEKVATGAPTVFSRNELGNNQTIRVWYINDTDQHVLLDKDGSKSLFTQSVRNTYIGLRHVAGSACGYAEAYASDGKITQVMCNGDVFTRDGFC